MPRNLLRRPVLLLIVIATLACASVWWFAWMSPQGHSLSSLHQQQVQGIQHEADLSEQLAQLETEAKQVKAARNFPSRFEQAIPPDPDAPGLVIEVYRLSQRTGVTLESITDDSVNPASSAYSSMPVSISIAGGHNAVISFVAGLYKLPRLLVIQSLSLSGAGALNASGNGQYIASISATAYTTKVSASPAKTSD